MQGGLGRARGLPDHFLLVVRFKALDPHLASACVLPDLDLGQHRHHASRCDCLRNQTRVGTVLWLSDRRMIETMKKRRRERKMTSGGFYIHSLLLTCFLTRRKMQHNYSSSECSHNTVQVWGRPWGASTVQTR